MEAAPGTRMLARALVASAAIAICSAIGAQSAVGATYVVSPSGSDSASGGEGAPFQTISRAAASARSGDTVSVRAGRYPETVVVTALNRGVQFRGAPGERPVIDGEGTRPFGFQNNSAPDVTITGFEITGQTLSGIYSNHGERNVISGNEIHHVGKTGDLGATGIRSAWGHDSRISGNEIHHIGPGWQAIGVWLLETRDTHVDDNVVYLVRKEGIRDWKGLGNTISGNRSFLNWVGLSLNTSTGSRVTGNYVYDNVEGIAVKHQSYATVLSYWGLETGAWSRITGNTVYRSTETALWLAQSDQPMDYVEVTGNVFSGAGTAFVRDIPSLRGPHVVVDDNSYSDEGGQPSWLYKAGWSSDPGLGSWEAVRSLVGWERDGARQAAFAEPTGVARTDISWTPFAMTPVDSSSKGTWYTRTHLDKTSDNDQNSYWMTATGQDEYVVFDFGRPRTFNHLVLSVYSHEDRRNVRGYRFEVSDDGHTWSTVKEGTNPDAAGSAYPYELDRPRTGRYLRFTAVDNFCSCEGFVISDLKAGMLATAGWPDEAPVVTPAPRAKPPAARAIAQPGLSVVGRARLAARRRLRIPVRCSGLTGPLRAAVAIMERRRGRAAGRRLAGAAVRVTPGCRVLTIPLSRALVRRIRSGRLARVTLSVRFPGGLTRSLRVRVAR